jgi:Na+-driven multidrug efflux pump
VRTLALRAVLVTTTWVAAGLGDVPLASHQVAVTIWSFLAFALDAIAIAAQALTGKSLGAGDVAGVRSATNLMIRWGLGLGVVLGLIVLALRFVLPHLFTNDPAIQSALAAALLVVAVGQPLAAYVFVVDGVLIGADDGRWLAWASVVVFVLYLPLVLGVRAAGERLLAGSGTWSGAELAVVWLWIAFSGFMTIRAVSLWLRVRTTTWMVTGTR